MTATLTFQLPEEQEDHEIAVNGWRYKSALAAMDERLRNLFKYGAASERAEFTSERAREWLWDCLREAGVQDI